MRKTILFLILSMAPLAPLHAQSMPVATFLAKADALKKKGALAFFSGDLGRLKSEIQNSGKAIRLEHQAAVKAGRKPGFCIPAKASFTSTELLDHFRAIPPAQRNMPVKAAFASLVRKKYPCPS